MAQIETLGILEEIESLISDRLQVVSYKWLSRNYLVSSNAAKRLLQEFVEKHRSGLEVVYTLSGWLKGDLPNYHIKLVSGPKLSEAKQEFDGNCSVQVYSVQTSTPKDPAALWNAEHVQAEELFRQHFTVDNCLRDNRFCGISNTFVKRNVDGTPSTVANPLPKTVGGLGQAKSSSVQNTIVPQSQQYKAQQSSERVGLQSPNVVKDVENEGTGTGVRGQSTNPPAEKEKYPPLPAGKNKAQNGKSASDTGGSLANFWGRASAKAKPSVPSEKNVISNPIASAEAQICAREALDGSDDDGDDINFKRASVGEGSRKRRVVFDLSDEDEYEDAINLASPDIPKGQQPHDQKQSTKVVLEKSSLNFDKETEEDMPKVKEEIVTDRESNQALREDSFVVSNGESARTSSTEKVQSCIPENDLNKDNATLATPNSPKRRKVLKTVIDERGREVTKVIWDGEETEGKKADSSATKKHDSSTSGNNVNRPPGAKKSPPMGNTAPSNPTGKAGNKKAGNSKDPKQGNILSFFKRV